LKAKVQGDLYPKNKGANLLLKLLKKKVNIRKLHKKKAKKKTKKKKKEKKERLGW